MPLTHPDRFWSFVDCADPTGCWPWRGRIDTGGYGEYWLHGGKRRAHRVAYELVVGPIPAGLQIDHLCRVRHCVNPTHMEPVTPRENTRRGLAGHHGRGSSDTHCRHGHPWDEANTYFDRRGSRVCRTCRRLSVRRYEARKRSDNHP